MTTDREVADLETRERVREILASVEGMDVSLPKRKHFLRKKSAWELIIAEPNFYPDFKAVMASLGENQSSIRLFLKMYFGEYWYQCFDPKTKLYSPFHNILQLEALRKGVTYLALPASATETYRITGCILENFIFKHQITRDKLLNEFKNLFDTLRVVQLTMRTSGIMQNGNGNLEIVIEDNNGHRMYS